MRDGEGILNHFLIRRIGVLWGGQLALILGVKYLILRLGLRGEVRGINRRSKAFILHGGGTDIRQD